ncbi:MAG: hypothetical protein HY225_01955 [Candidatus Vogelbacteria bacterium]|nr:hypothetical protein [Candidatus Vogelbacteria bacterium]
MRRNAQELNISQALIPLSEFMESYNKNMPVAFPRATAALLKKFKEDHALLFKHGDLWSLDQHRKKLMDWLPRNSKLA